MKTSLLLCAALMLPVGCIEQPDQLRDTDQAVDLNARDRFFWLNGGAVFSQVQTSAGSGAFNTTEPLGGTGFTKLATERQQDGRLSVFAVGPAPDFVLFGRYQASVGGGWNSEGWESLGGAWIKQIATTHHLDGRIQLFVLNTSGQAFYRYQTTVNAGWNSDGWAPFGGHDIQSISAVRRNDGRIEVVAAGGDGKLYRRVQATVNAGWDADWAEIPGTNLGLRNVALLLDGSFRPTLFAIDSTNHLRFAREDGSTGTWQTPMTVDAFRTIDQFVVGLTHDHRLDVLAISGGSVFDANQTDFFSTAMGVFNSVGWGGVAQLSWTNARFDTPFVFARKTGGTISSGTAADTVPIGRWSPLTALSASGTDLVAIDQQ